VCVWVDKGCEGNQQRDRATVRGHFVCSVWLHKHNHMQMSTHTQSTYNLLIKKKSSWTGSNTKDLNWLRHRTETLQIYSTTRGKYLRTAGGGFTELMWSGIPVHFLSEMSQMEESRMLSTSTLTKVSLQSRLLDIKSTAFIKSELTQMAGLPNTQTITHTLSPFNTCR